MQSKLACVFEIEEELSKFFGNKSYSNDLENLYIGIFCMSPNFEPFFAQVKPVYRPLAKTYTRKGIKVHVEAKTYSYEVRLDFSIYNKVENIKSLLANDIIDSLTQILECNKIKSLDINSFKDDFRSFFKGKAWL